MNKDRIRIGLIGSGYLGKHHARILSGLDKVSLEAIVDTDISIASAISAQYGSKFFTNFVDAMDLVDAFVIATPTASHHNIAKECLNNKKHLFIEKPITATSQEAKELIALANSLNLIIQVGHIERFNPVFRYALNRVDIPIMFESQRLSPFLERSANIDVCLDLLIHDIDLVLSFLRAKRLDTSIKDISAEGVSMVSNKIDLVIARIRFASSSAILKASRIAKDKQRQMAVYEKGSYLTLDFTRQTITEFQSGDISFNDINVESREELLQIEMSSFIDSLINNCPPVVTAQQALEALQIAEKINQLIGA